MSDYRHVDICTFSTIVTTYVPFLSCCEQPWRTGAIVGAVLGGLLSRWRLATSVRADELCQRAGETSRRRLVAHYYRPCAASHAGDRWRGAKRTTTETKVNSTAAEFAKFVRELPENDEDDVATAEEKVDKAGLGPN